MICAQSDGVVRLARPGSIIALAILFATFFAAVTFAAADETAGDCLGVGFDANHLVSIAKIIADRPQVHFIKNASDDPTCPADRESCLQPDYLAPGDLVLLGKTHGAYSCVSYQSADDRSQRWTVGWLPSASLTPVTPSAAPSLTDWSGHWIHAGGHIDIRRGRRGYLRIAGEQVYPAAQNVHSGVIHATAKPAHGVLQFTSADARDCMVRMQRIAALLVVEDNDQCGGQLVTFTGFYRRKG
jgi:hypothetical protein